MGVVLQSETTNALTRITVHGQYNHRAFGFFLLNNLIPIVLNVRKPGGHYRRSILMYTPVTRRNAPYEDYGMITTECAKVLTFNIRHYVKCYLYDSANGMPTGAFTYNQCFICGASVKDSNGRLLQQISRRSYRPDKYVWRPNSSLQNKTGEQPIFTHHEGML